MHWNIYPLYKRRIWLVSMKFYTHVVRSQLNQTFIENSTLSLGCSSQYDASIVISTWSHKLVYAYLNSRNDFELSKCGSHDII